jgi:hypothetical protein
MVQERGLGAEDLGGGLVQMNGLARWFWSAI